MKLLLLAGAVVGPGVGTAAGAAGTVGAHQLLAKVAAGVRLDSATTAPATGLGGTGTGNATSTRATSPQGQ